MKQFTGNGKRSVLGNIYTVDGISYASDGYKSVRMSIGLKDGLKPVRNNAYNGEYPDIANIITPFWVRANLIFEVNYHVFIHSLKIAKVFDTLQIGVYGDKITLMGAGEQGNTITLLESQLSHDNSNRLLYSKFTIPSFNIPKCETVKIGFYDEMSFISITCDDTMIVLGASKNERYVIDETLKPLKPFTGRLNKSKRYKNKPLYIRKHKMDTNVAHHVRKQDHRRFWDNEGDVYNLPYDGNNVVSVPVETLDLRGIDHDNI